MRKDFRERVVVTGMGAITPVGVDLPSSWQALKQGEHGIQRVEDTYLAQIPGMLESPARVAAPAPEVNFAELPGLKEANLPVNRWHKSAALGFVAMFEALYDAGLIDSRTLKIDENQVDRFRVGYYVGSTFSGADELAMIIGPQAKRARPSNLFRYLPARAATAPAMELNLGGPGGMIAEECASGGSAIRLGAKELLPYWSQKSDADVMVVGGTDGEISVANLRLFNSVPAVDPTDIPEKASRPFDQDAKGLVMGEAAGAMVLERLGHFLYNRRRLARIYAELVGIANLTDAENETKAAHDGTKMVIRQVLEQAGVVRGEIVYLNAHATSTPEGDPIEGVAIKEAILDSGLDPKDFWVTSTKGATGHTMGGAGAIEANFAVKALQDSVVPPGLKLHNPIPEVAGLNLSPLEKTELGNIDVAISTSYGFGGTATALAFRKYKEY